MTTTGAAWQHADWTTVPMAEPWHRDLLLGPLMDHEHKGDLDAWSLRIAEHYGRSGTLEITAVIIALRAEVERLQMELAGTQGMLMASREAVADSRAEASRLQGVLDGYRARLMTEAEEANARTSTGDQEALEAHYEDGRVNGLCRALSLLDEAREGKR